MNAPLHKTLAGIIAAIVAILSAVSPIVLIAGKFLPANSPYEALGMALVGFLTAILTVLKLLDAHVAITPTPAQNATATNVQTMAAIASPALVALATPPAPFDPTQRPDSQK